MGDQIVEADYYFDLSYCDGLVIITCARCGGFEIVVERSREGRRRARERTSLHVLAVHESGAC